MWIVPNKALAFTTPRALMRRAPAALEGQLPDVAPAVLGALGDKDAGAHAAMWDMLLSFVRAFPEAWSVIDARKTFLPRLLALLRCSILARSLSEVLV